MCHKFENRAIGSQLKKNKKTKKKKKTEDICTDKGDRKSKTVIFFFSKLSAFQTFEHRVRTEY